MAAICIASPALATCPSIVSGGSESCTVTDADGLNAISLSASGVNDNTSYSLTNQASLTADTDYGDTAFGISLEIDGSDGTTSSKDGENGGDITINNSGGILVDGTSDKEYSHSQIGGIKVRAEGGDGAEPDDDGDGGRGGDGGVLSIDNSASITIDSGATLNLSTEIIGIWAQTSAGAGGDMNTAVLGDQKGGNSGDAKAVTLTNSGAITLGASGASVQGNNLGRAIDIQANGNDGGSENGEGGSGGEVTLTNTANLDVYYEEVGAGSYGVHGIFVKSHGGNGAASFDNSDDGGRGEDGRTIQVTNSGAITVELTGQPMTGESAGILIESVGGNGGTSSNKSTGGCGGNAGAASDDDSDNCGRGDSGSGEAIVEVTQTGSVIDVSGDGVRGIVARSQGGNGGDGNGDSNSSGGNGGTGGQIQVTFQDGSSINSNGSEAYGILGQSVGGTGGGNAGTAGRGGDAGSVGVYASSDTSITTVGDYSAGITLHSVGGGGGTGEDFTGVLAGSGGNGGNGGDAEKVSITTGATITTSGQYAYGVLGQSIGGSGGTGGISDGLTLELGGDGGGGGAAGAIDINNTGTITTSGNYAYGILGQSLSGGGGAAGTAGGVLAVGGSAGSASDNTALAYVTNSGDVTTTGEAAAGIIVQSIGGGGGTGGGADGIFTIGGSGDAGGDGGEANVYHVGGTVRTSGDHAYGLVAQSVGGGGGSGGDVIDVSAGVGVGVGGSGSAGGNGGEVCMTNFYDGECAALSDSGSEAPAQGSSAIYTNGQFAHGIVAQSIGGGGGNGGDFEGGSVASIASVQIGGEAADGGGGGAVYLDFDNLTLTTGNANSNGILAQSIGGGGGNGGDSTALNGVDPIAIQIGGAGGAGGAGGDVQATVNDSVIATRNANASSMLLQSIGGGGGTGGSAHGADVSFGFTFETAVGGGGGNGGAGQYVTANLSNTCLISGTSSDDCTVTADQTNGSDSASSHGLVMQSIGGGGGTGGSSVAAAMAIAVPDFEGESFAASAAISVGGDGGEGGHGGEIDATLSDGTTIVTGGDGSHGIFAQSIGGGGGDGGSASALAGTISVPNTISVDLSVGLGGDGSAGGNGNVISLDLQDTAQIVTFGSNSNGIVAQSVGGGGGDGGMGNASSDKIGRGINFSISAGLGGQGGSGGTGGDVTLSMSDAAQISTFGSGSNAILAQSIGGGGGIGQGGSVNLKASGFTLEEAGKIRQEEGADPKSVLKFNVAPEITFDVGGVTGDGNVAGDMTVTANGKIQTAGDDADAVIVQSIGGGGGVGGSAGLDDSGETGGSDNSDGSLVRPEIAIDTTAAITLSLGGEGGTGGHGGDIHINHYADIQTSGDFADGVLVQSIGGGGGAGGAAGTGDGDQTWNINMALGGTGGVGGNGGDIYFATQLASDTDAPTTTSTAGYGAHGIVLQTIGAGGGQGAAGTAAGAGSEDVEIGGGNFTPSLDFGLGLSLGAGFGGNGGGSGDGGDIFISTDQGGEAVTVNTLGDDAYGMLLQSIGGGGGTAGAGAAQQGEGRLSIDLEITMGGNGGAAGDGGQISSDYFEADVSTQGTGSIGILAQSIGGGGGAAGTSGSGSGGDGSDDSESHLNVSLTADGGASGDGGYVALYFNQDSEITTEGDGAHAVVAQSIGGGGGLAGDLTATTLDTGYPTSSDSTAEGDGGIVELVNQGRIETTGDMAFGILAQSVGGSGGILAQNGTLYIGTAGGGNGLGKDVSVTVDSGASVSATGVGSIGIFAQSVAPVDNGTITIDISGDVTGGSGDGSGIYVSEGDNNQLTVESGGSVSAGGSEEDGNRGTAVRYLGSNTQDFGNWLTVTNYGEINGDIVLESSDQQVTNPDTSPEASISFAETPTIAGQVHNMEGAVWTLDADAVVHVENAGMIKTAGDGSNRGYRFVGDFVQSETGVLQVAADFVGGASDLVTFENDVTLVGKLRVDAASVMGGRFLSVLQFQGDVSGAIEVEDSATLQFGLDATETEARIQILSTSYGSFGGLNKNQREVGAHLDRIFDAGDDGFGDTMAGLSALADLDDDGASYAQALTSLTPGGALAAAASQGLLAQSRMNGAMVCRSRSISRYDRTGTCSWFDVSGTEFDQGGTGGYDGHVTGFSGGVLFDLDSDWTFGAAIGYENASFTDASGASTADGDGGFIALAAGRMIGGFEIAGALTASYGSYDLTRNVTLPNMSSQATGQTSVTSYGARLQGSKTFGSATGYVRPTLAVDVVHTDADGYTETGAGAMNLSVADQSQTIAVLTPSIEFGRDITLGDGSRLSLFAAAGASFANRDEWTSTARFAGASNGAGHFTSSVPIRDKLGRIELGLSWAQSDQFEARVEYGGGFGEDFESHDLAVGLTMRF